MIQGEMVGLPLGIGAVAVTEPEAEVPWPLTATARAAMRRRALENMTARNKVGMRSFHFL